jgi:hypothetical protein
MTFEPQKEEIKGDGRKLHNENLHGLNSFTKYVSV